MHFYPYKILDPIHGFIRFNELEQKVIETPFFQRLRYIHQMGMTYLLYPGAKHTRFEHSIGVMELSGRIFDVLVGTQREGSVNLALSEKEIAYWRSIVRLAALCHDMGHLPFSHTAEKSLLGPKGHEKMTFQILQNSSMHFINEALGPSALEDLLKVAIDEDVLTHLAPHLKKGAVEKLFSKIITEDNFGADRIDYLIRDAHATGVGYGHFDYHQLIDTLRILAVEGQWTVGILASGIQSVESLWIARYLMHARVYKHPKSCIYSAHMERYMSTLPFSVELSAYLHQTDYHVLETMAKSEDEDARILLKKEPAYQALLLTEQQQQSARSRLQELQQQFGRDLLYETSDAKQGMRSFWIYEERQGYLSSEGYSEFLHKIPLGIKSLQLFVRPRSYARMKDYLATLS